MKRINLRTGRAPAEGLEPEKAPAEEKPSNPVHSVRINDEADQPLAQRILRSQLFDRDRIRSLLIDPPDEMSYHPELTDRLMQGSRDLIRGNSLIDAVINNMRQPSMFDQIAAIARNPGGFASGGLVHGRTVMRSDIGLGDASTISVDPGSPEGDRTVVANIVPLDNASEVRTAVDRESRADLWLREYMSRCERNLANEGYNRADPYRRSLDGAQLTGDSRRMRECFRRLADRIPDGNLGESTHWGVNDKRIAIFGISGPSGHYIIGVKLSDTRRVMVHEYNEDHPLEPRQWSSWALGELIGWGQLGAR